MKLFVLGGLIAPRRQLMMKNIGNTFVKENQKVIGQRLIKTK